MTATIPLGRIAGVRVGLHWSAAGIIALLIVISIARWPQLVPGHTWPVYLLASVATALLFVASLLAHEVSHAVVARREGVGVDGITLWLLGGVARLRGEAMTPGAAFRIAVVGPLVSVAVAGVFGALAVLVTAAELPPLLTLVFGYLAVINAVLAVFNLVPAAPLDGGRVLRAALWAWRGDRHQAAIWSARAGRVFGMLLIVVGATWLLVGAGGDGLWWILLGLFIVTVASAEEHQAKLGAELGDLRVGDVMTQNPDTVSTDSTIGEFLHDVALVRRHSAFPLVDEHGRLDGLVTLNRLRSVPSVERDTTTLHEVACGPDDVPSARPGEPIKDLLGRMGGCADGRAIVLVDGRVAGIVTPTDISRAVTLRGLDITGQGGADVTSDYRIFERG